MDRAYPTIFEANKDGSYTATFPDLPGCVSEGRDLPEALSNSQRALAQWLRFLNESGRDIPAPSAFTAYSEINYIGPPQSGWEPPPWLRPKLRPPGRRKRA